MTARHILAIDQGTTNTKALLVDDAGRIVARAARPLTQHYPHPAWVEQDPLAIWQSVREAGDAALAQAGRPALAAIAVTNQRETVMLWERRSGQPLGPAVGWQCQRGAALCAELRARGVGAAVRARTGLTLDPMFSASKARWLLDQLPDGAARAAAGEICLGTMDAWVLWNLSGGATHACDWTNASRTQLFNLHTLAWDSELLDLYGLPLAMLPQARPSSAVQGVSVPCGLLPGGVPVTSLIGDSHAALFGHASFGAGTVKATYGTGSSLMAPTPTVVPSAHGLSSTVAWGRAPGLATYALEGNIYATGAAVQWLGETLRLPEPAAGIETLAAQVPDSGGVYFVPAFSGLGAPHWDERARGLFCGITLGTTAAHLARAAIEAVAYQVRDVFDALEADLGAPLQVLLADGGASRNDPLMQFQADILGRPVLRSESAELSALGAAYLAGLAVGVWAGEDEIARLAQHGTRFAPRLAEAARAALYRGWREALARATQATGL
jgi:glycerol kinase